MSVNEELQSTNEELETSKEELQSVNEELATVNTELQTKVNDLSRTNNDMNNLLAGTGVAHWVLRLLATAPEIPLAHQRSADFVHSRHVDNMLAKLEAQTRAILEHTRLLDAAPILLLGRWTARGRA